MSQQISPEVPVRLRRVRDSGALLFMLVFLGFLGYVIWDGIYMKGTDIDLIVHGHDSYGNICGRNNKPIKLSTKSGRNYTERPYTKYTLVNSKFERYTGRMRFGELVYVKEHAEVGRRDASFSLAKEPHEDRHEPKAIKPDGFSVELSTEGGILSLKKRQRETNSKNGAVSAISLLSAPDEDNSPRTRGDKAKLSNDKTSSKIPSFPTNSAHEDNNIRARPRSYGVEDDDGRAQHDRQRRSVPIRTEAPLMHFDLVELARTNRSLFNALRSNMMYQYPPMYGYSSQPSSSTGAAERFNRTRDDRIDHNNYASISAQAISPDGVHLRKDETNELVTMSSLARTSPRSVVVFAGQSARPTPRSNPIRVSDTSNDSEHYDHIFVTPRSVMTNVGDGSRLPSTGLISQNEVASQLLYLTECVPSCPSDHVELIFYRCMPNNWRFSLFPNAINVTRTFIDDILTDVSHCYRELVYTFSLSLVLSLALLILLRFLASMIVWSCIVLLILIFISMASYSWLTFYHQIMDLEQVMPHDSVYAEKLASSDKWLIGSIFLTFLAFAIIGTVLFMRKRILLVTTLFKESGKAIADMPLLLLQPLLTFAVLVFIMAAWTMGFICLQSMKQPVVDTHTGFVVYRTDTFYKIMRWYHVYSFLWVSHFAIACQHYVIGASVSKWYFSPNRYQLGSPIGTSISELILYYLGTVALGSFLLAIFKVIRIITRQIQFLVQRSCMSPPLNSNQAIGGGHYMNSSSTSSPSTSTCGSLGYIWRLFIWFFDNIVMIINRDAYVEVAIHGHSFLGGARRAFFVLASNPLRLLAIKSVGNLLLVIAKICVVVGTVSMAYMLLEGKNQHLNYSWSPIVISAIFAYIVAHWFLSVYEMVIDALFICYCEDFEQKNNELNQTINGSNFRAQILNNGQIY